MAEYIEHSAVIGLLRRYNGDIVVREIERLPITNIRPEKHGKWVCDGAATICSVCRERSIYDFETPYCQWCGAVMDGKETENDTN